MKKFIKYAKYTPLLLLVLLALSLGGVFATWQYATGDAAERVLSGGLSLNWDTSSYLGDPLYEGENETIYGSVEGNTADNEKTLFDGDNTYSADTQERWTNWSSDSSTKGDPVTWSLAFSEEFTFDEVRIHHFCDHGSCFIPKEVEISYGSGNLFAHAETADATSESLTGSTGSGWNQSRFSYTCYSIDGTFSLSDDNPDNVSFKTNWDNAKDYTGYKVSSNSSGWGGNSTTTYNYNCFACDIGGTTTYFTSDYTGTVPYTSFYYSDTSSITTNEITLTLTPQTDRFVGIVELEFYLDGTEVAF